MTAEATQETIVNQSDINESVNANNSENSDISVENTEDFEIEIEVVQESEESDDSQEQKEEKQSKKTERVDFDTPEQQARFNDVYKQLKMSDNRNKMLTDFLQEQQKQLEEIKGRFQKSDESDAEKLILTKIKHAREEGNDEAYDQAFADLVEFRAAKVVDKKVSEFTQKEYAEADNDAKYVANLMGEKSEDGGFKRPWLQESDSRFNEALSKLSVIAYKYINDPNALQKSLTELDLAMSKKEEEKPKSKQPSTRYPHPMQGSNLTNHKPKNTIKMTRQEMEIAKKLGVDPKKYAARRDAEKGKK